MLKKCPHCGNQFTLETTRCPRCDGILPKKRSFFVRLFKWTILLAGGGFVALFVAALISVLLESPEETKAREARAASRQQTAPQQNAPVQPSPIETKQPNSPPAPNQPNESTVATTSPKKERAEKRKKPANKQTGLTDAEQAGIRLLALEKKGLIEITDPGAGSMFFIYVEPKFWAAGKHADKKNLCITALQFLNELDAQKNPSNRHVGINFYDMTSKKRLAGVELQTGRIDIYK